MIFSIMLSLSLAITIETMISILIGIRNWKDIKTVACANILTNPITVFLAYWIKMLKNDLIYYIFVIIIEILVIIVEFIIYKKYLEYREKSPLCISIINNIISYSLGVIISTWIF